MLLAYDDVGPGPVVVLLHGFPLDRSMWAHQRSSVGAIYRVIVPDFRGHGTSAAPEGVYEVDSMADDVLELLDGLGIVGSVVFGGLSMGGYVALSIVDRHPERVKALMLMDTRASADAPEAARARLRLAEEIEASGSTGSFVTPLIPRYFASSTIEGQPRLVARVLEQMAKTPTRSVVSTLRGLANRPDRTAVLGQIRVPTLVLTGAEDSVIPPDEARSMAGQIAGSSFVIVPGAGHLPPLEKPEAVDSAILEFLEALW